MEVIPLRAFSSSILLLFKIAVEDMKNCELLLEPLQDFFQSLATNACMWWNKWRTTPAPADPNETIKTKEFMSLRDVNMVMEQLGLQCCHDESSNIDILSVFDHEGPSFDEVKAAFDVFDENADGFIDEFELRRMLVRFGQPENEKLEQCRNMIERFDVNGDGLIDFDEFVRLMETCSF